MTTKKASSKKTKSKSVKKTVKKTAPKKTTTTTAAAKKKTAATPKKSSKQSASKRTIVTAGNGKTFWTHDGQIIANLIELRDLLDRMEEAVYSYHVTKEKNDFADWVETVLKDAECATALRRSKKPKSARTIVVRHLKLYDI